MIDSFTLSTSEQQDYAFVDDPIALSCAAYRQYQLHPANRWPDLNEMTVESQDREQADVIRKYYADRLVLDVLRQQQPISGFRRKLYGLVTGSVKLKKHEIGMVYRLPYFYEEDTGLDQIAEQTTSADIMYIGNEITAEFVLKKHITKSRRTGEFVQFWLTRTGDSAAYAVMLKIDNPFLSLLNSVVAYPTTLKVRAWTKQFRGHHRDRMYYQLGNLELVRAS
jgi:hypothetical protein